MSITEIFRRITSYISFFYNSRTIQRVHSPFVFKLLNEIFQDNKNKSDFDKINSLVKELKNNNTVIAQTDFGAPSEKSETTYATVNKKIKTIAKKVISSKQEGKILYNLTKHFQPQIILEFGTSLGIGTSFLAMGNPSAKTITMEGCPEITKLAKKNFDKLNISNIEIIQGDFKNTLNNTLKNINKLDLVYFDGNHREKPTIEYFEKCLPKIHNNTIFIF
ncbi:MAG: class I SAM-dependent methyltransferase, partial [Bacteroidota bacterium]|nr:class I SAM-dependent methyltransferase [Bacteroidota bacterium]